MKAIFLPETIKTGKEPVKEFGERKK